MTTKPGARDRSGDPMRFKDFERIVFFTGAGMSAESGVPTYRGAGGIWREYDYRAYACQDAFDADPASDAEEGGAPSDDGADHDPDEKPGDGS